MAKKDEKDTAQDPVDGVGVRNSAVEVTLTDAERAAATKDGLKQAVAESAKTDLATKSGLESNTAGDRWPDRHEIMQWAHIVELGVEEFVKAVAKDAEPLIAEGKIAGLLELERSGKNRTPFVKALCDRLGVKDPREVTSAGPSYTVDVTPISHL
jgi:hypothetical protein